MSQLPDFFFRLDAPVDHVQLAVAVAVAVAVAAAVAAEGLRVPDELALAIRQAAKAAGLSVSAYIVRAARRAATLDATRQLAELGLGQDLAGEGDAL
ncbi:type II toxin -antitoxin system TacA 1-like antitoxin [Streptomyces sp. NPDC055006]